MIGEYLRFFFSASHASGVRQGFLLWLQMSKSVIFRNLFILYVELYVENRAVVDEGPPVASSLEMNLQSKELIGF